MKRLTLTYRMRRILSDAFNFKAYRMMYDALDGKEITREALDAAALDGVAALFDGTELTGDILLGGEIDAGELLDAMRNVIDWYRSARPQARGSKAIGTPPPKPLHTLYRSLLERHGLTPSEVDKQDPQLLYDVMGAEYGDMMSVDDIPPESRPFYGM